MSHIKEQEQLHAMTVTKEDVMIAVEAARDKKALDPVLLEVSEVSTYADYFFICSGRSVIQVKALVSAIEQALKERGILPLHVEGLSEGRWVLLDYDELIIHIFLEETRTFYNLERLWNDVPHTSFADDSAPAEASVLSHGD